METRDILTFMDKHHRPRNFDQDKIIKNETILDRVQNPEKYDRSGRLIKGYSQR